MTLQASIRVEALSDYSKANDLSTSRDHVGLSVELSFTEGTGNNQADKVFHDTRTLTTGATENLDLAGTLTDVYGVTCTFVKVKAMVFQNLSATQTLTIGGVGTNGFVNWAGANTHTVIIPPLGFFALVAPLGGYAVTAGTGDLLKVLNSAGASVDYKVWIIGTSA